MRGSDEATRLPFLHSRAWCCETHERPLLYVLDIRRSALLSGPFPPLKRLVQ